VLETHCPGVVKAPEFSRMSLVEREAWVQAAKAVEEHVAIAATASVAVMAWRRPAKALSRSAHGHGGASAGILRHDSGRHGAWR